MVNPRLNLPQLRPDFRRALVFGTVALIGIIVGENVGGIHADNANKRLIAWGLSAIVLIFGVLATRSAANECDRITQVRGGPSAAAALRIITLLFGYLITLGAVASMIELPIGRWIVGGSITAIVLGIAAQQVLGNLFAGFLLLFSRPYVPGERIRVLSGALGGPHVGVVTAVGLLYTQLETPEGLLNIPNSALLAAAVGPATPKAVSGTNAPDDEVPPPEI